MNRSQRRRLSGQEEDVVSRVGHDIVPVDVDVRRSRDGSLALVPIEELDIDMGGYVDCHHTFWYEGNPLRALEPDPESGYWVCCPRCGLQRGQLNRGEVPAEFRAF